MFKKLHLQMTLFCALITGSILICFSLALIHTSEIRIRENTAALFETKVQSVLSYLENTNQISYDWLSKMQNNGQLLIYMEENSTPLLFSELSQNEAQKASVQTARNTAIQDYSVNFSSDSVLFSQTNRIDFEDNNYKTAVLQIPKEKGTLNTLLLYSLSTQNNQIRTQRITYIVLDVAAFLLLSIFAWFFTGFLLKPVEINRNRQTAFIAAASHELRTPLMIARNSLSAMDQATAEEQKQFKNIIYQENKKMSRLVDDMLLLARTDNSAWEIHPIDTELDTLIVDVYEKYALQAADKEIDFTFQLPLDMLETCRCDKTRIEQVMSILTDNALAYTPAKGQVEIGIRKLPGIMEMYVKDNGPGIPDAEKERIFERFYRSDRSIDGENHFGLGLCIAKEIITLHHGTIKVTDAPPSGSIFIVQIPLIHRRIS